MYGETSSVIKIAGGAATSAAGIVMLPATSGNTVGLLLAYSAIAIGIIALVSQLVVRGVRRYYAVRQTK